MCLLAFLYVFNIGIQDGIQDAITNSFILMVQKQAHHIVSKHPNRINYALSCIYLAPSNSATGDFFLALGKSFCPDEET